MQAFETITGIVAPIDQANIDTDQIIPKQFLKSIKRSGFGPNLFDEWRYLDEGAPGQDNNNRPINKNFVLNQSPYQQAKVLLTRDNFGCGSSREHAPWALADFGFRVIIAPSFADIFYNNCFKNGLLPIILPSKIIDELFIQTAQHKGFEISVDLLQQIVSAPEPISFEIDEIRKQTLLKGLDEIGMSLESAAAIKAYEMQRLQQEPWLNALPQHA